jgi:hypothetical protein
LSTHDLFLFLQDSELAIEIGQLNIVFGIFAQLFHIAGLMLVLTSVLLVNLRLLGTGLTQVSALQLDRASRPYILLGLVFLILSGLFMFVPSAALYEPNPAFWLKLKLLGIALVLHFTLHRHIVEKEAPDRRLAIVSASASLVLWFAIGLAGRAIGFVAA